MNNEQRVRLAIRADPTATEFAPLTRSELRALLARTKGATPVTLVTLTVPSYRRTGCPFKDNLLKLARVNGLLNWNYEGAVNRQRVREDVTPDFEALPRAWGSHLDKTPFVSHVTKKGDHRLYVRVKIEHALTHEYIDKAGNPLAFEEVKYWLAAKAANLRQGINHEVLERDYDVENVISAKLNGQGYIVEGP